MTQWPTPGLRAGQKHGLLASLLTGALLLATGCLPGDGMDAWVLAGNTRAANLDYSAALRFYETAQASRQFGGGVAVRIGKVHLSKGRLALAEQWLAAASAECFEADQDPWAARLPLSRCGADVVAALGRTYARQGRLVEATAALGDAWAADRAGAGYELALVLLRSGEDERARRLLGALGAEQPAAALALAFLTALDDPLSAFPLLLAAPDPRREAESLAAALAGQTGAAAAEDRAMLVGRAAVRAGLPEVALAAFSTALEYEPGWEQALAHRAYARYLIGDSEAAQTDAMAALAIDEGEANALHVLGLLSLGAGDAAGARDRLEEAYRVDPTNSAILCDLGDTYAILHNYDQAVSDLNAAVRLDPLSPVPLMRLARFHFSTLVAVDSGLEAAREATRMAPESAEALRLLGWGLYLTGRPFEALTALERSLEADPFSAETHYHKGKALQSLGRSVEAGAAFRRAADLDTGGTIGARAAAAMAAAW